MHTLVTFLGKSNTPVSAGYRTAKYLFPDGLRETPFFGMALAEHLRPDKLIILGTSGSMWSVLVEHAVQSDGEEEARLDLMAAEEKANVDQVLLNRVTPVMRRPGGAQIVARLIPYGRTELEQQEILQTISVHVERGEVSFDLTHGFRQLGMVGMLSAFMLQRIGPLQVHSLWYGALDMTDSAGTPVLRLDGLHVIQHWISALDRFDASGNYGVFSPLLKKDGVPDDKARCLEEAAFHERTFNLSQAARKLQTFLKATEAPLPGASGLFQSQLRQRLSWADRPHLAAWQQMLAGQYLQRGDYVRAAVFAWESLISCKCRGQEQDPDARDRAKNGLVDTFEDDKCNPIKRRAFTNLRLLRNALAHGARPRNTHVRTLLASPQKLEKALANAIQELLPPLS